MTTVIHTKSDRGTDYYLKRGREKSLQVLLKRKTSVAIQYGLSLGCCWDSREGQGPDYQRDWEGWESGGHTGGEYGPSQLWERHQRL